MGMLRPGSARLSGIVIYRLEKATKNFRNAGQKPYTLAMMKIVSIAGGKLHSDSATIPQLLGE